MTAHLAHILRHPIKSVGYEEIESAPLTRGRALPFDRHWAIAHQAAKSDGPITAWAGKQNFLRGAAAPGLMAIRAATAVDGRVTLTHPVASPLAVHPDLPEDQAALMEWLRPFWPAHRPAPRSVEHVPGMALADSPEPYVSVLSRSSLDALGAAAGVPLSRNRFRGNLWVEGWVPWSEPGLVGRNLRIGTALLEIVEPITRCRAICANPETGHEDLDVLSLLRRLNGNAQFGLFALVREAGTVTRGDHVEIS
ncbi:MOSC domain-containing protein [Pontitalea aquivivens]|uniref:MOSC domain-containing protein n=1 Tax=Pontitalea aquivivens TaxID=3388663 RepID=UPI0039705341